MAPSLLGLFIAGALTFASPCVLPLIPAYLAALGGGVIVPSRSRMVLTATAFAAGMSTVFVLLGATASVIGDRLIEHRPALLLASGVLMVLFGLHALGILRIPFLDREARPALARVRTGGSVAAAFLFGVAFAVGWSPCIGPLLASALTYAASHSENPLKGAALLAVYASGIAIPLVVTAALADRAVGWLRRSGSILPRIERATGALLVGAGLWMAYDSRVVSDALLLGKPAIAGPQLIEFTSQDCPACRRMEPVLARAEASCTWLAERTMRVDVGTAPGLKLARSLNVVATPTFVLVGGDNTEHARLIGELPEKKLEAAVQSAFGLRCAAVSTPGPSSG